MTDVEKIRGMVRRVVERAVGRTPSTTRGHRRSLVTELDLEGVPPGGRFEVPAGALVTPLARQAAMERKITLVRDPGAGDFGLNLTYGLTSNLTLDGTYNPDFSQVEADASQVDVNLRYQLDFPEKRAFFREGGEHFAVAATGSISSSTNLTLRAL